VDIFLIFEEMVAMDGKAPPMARKDLCEILEKKRKHFVKCFHVIAVHPKLQVYHVRDLHNTVHAGLLRPAIKPFLQAIAKEGKPHVYYSASAHSHINSFLSILNGREVTKLKSFPKLDFKVAMSKLKTGVVGQRWNIQHTWAIASLNMKRNGAQGLINVPTIKFENVSDSILPQFVALSELLLEIDKSHEFYCGLPEGEEERSRHVQCLMDEDCLIPPETRIKNVIESVSGICNVYQRASKTCMYSGAHNAIFGADHQITRPRQGTSGGSNNKDLMIAKFLGWGIDVK
jgi:hypothetical protein